MKNKEKIIILTVREAKNIVETLDSLCEFVDTNTNFVSDLFLDGYDAKKFLEDRIKQLEIEHHKKEIV